MKVYGKRRLCYLSNKHEDSLTFYFRILQVDLRESFQIRVELQFSRFNENFFGDDGLVEIGANCFITNDFYATS